MSDPGKRTRTRRSAEERKGGGVIYSENSRTGGEPELPERGGLVGKMTRVLAVKREGNCLECAAFLLLTGEELLKKGDVLRRPLLGGTFHLSFAISSICLQLPLPSRSEDSLT